MNKTYNFQAKLWLYSSEKSSWHFITLPLEIAEEINFMFGNNKRGWGSLPVKVTIGTSVWKTSIFPDKKSGSFMLPIKASVRKEEGLIANEEIEVTLEISD
jgi:hypothetical protein